MLCLFGAFDAPDWMWNKDAQQHWDRWRTCTSINRLRYSCKSCHCTHGCTVEPLYNEVLGTMKITLLYQVSHYIRVKKQRNIKSWDQQNYLVIGGFCYIRPRYNEVPLYCDCNINLHYYSRAWLYCCTCMPNLLQNHFFSSELTRFFPKRAHNTHLCATVQLHTYDITRKHVTVYMGSIWSFNDSGEKGVLSGLDTNRLKRAWGDRMKDTLGWKYLKNSWNSPVMMMSLLGIPTRCYG